MDYSPDAFAALYEEIEKQSGAILPDLCIPQDSDFTDPPYHNRPGVVKGVTCGCRTTTGEDEPLTRFVATYDLPEGKEGKLQKKRGGGFVTACAVCDSMGAWPRFEEAVYAADPEMDIRMFPDEDDYDEEEDE